MVPLDVLLRVEPEDHVAQAERRLHCQCAIRRGVHAVAEEENPVGFDVHHARLDAVVATDVADVDGHTAEVELDLLRGR